jgi:exopolysaccharide biosynthesis polyprenyl glycosylphosphotransferase
LTEAAIGVPVGDDALTAAIGVPVGDDALAAAIGVSAGDEALAARRIGGVVKRRLGGSGVDRRLGVDTLFIALMTALALLLVVLMAGIHDVGTVVVATVGIGAIWVASLWPTGSISHRLRRNSLGPLTGGTFAFAAASALDDALLHGSLMTSTLLLMSGSAVAAAATFRLFALRMLESRLSIVVVGTDDRVVDAIRELESHRRPRFDLIGFVGDRAGVARVGAHRLGCTSDLVEVVRTEKPDIVICGSESRRTTTVDRLLEAGLTRMRVISSDEFYEFAFGRVSSSAICPAWFASVLGVDARPFSTLAKRIFDLVFATLALVVLAPVAAVIASLVRASSPGPVIYRQMRSGERGELFEMLKFRTMVVDAESGEAVWATKNDPRVTRIGRLLRVTRLDEVPQLVNVLRGEMSIVGPRPERPEYLDLLRAEIPLWTRRHLLKPGITGWAQVSLSYTSDVGGAAQKLAYDLYYLKHRGFGLDCLILAKTISIVLTGRGAR